MRRIILLGIIVFSSISAFSRVLTREVYLAPGPIRTNNTTVLSGYGHLKFEYDLRYKTGTANLTRNVLFLGHKQNFLHDGSAHTLIEAIMWHGGEAAQSKEFVKTLTKAGRDALIKFLESLGC